MSSQALQNGNAVCRVGMSEAAASGIGWINMIF